MSDIKITVGADVGQAVTGLRAVQGELGKTASVAKTATASFSSIGSSIGSLAGSLLSGGILVGIAAVGAGLISLAQNAFEMSKAQQQLTDILSEAKGAYVKATLEVDKMKVAFEQARSGVITKEEALKLYNTTLGKTIGQTNDIDEAERRFIGQAQNYIKFTLLKAAANIALGKAAEAAFKAAQEKQVGPRQATILERLGAGRFGGPTDEQRMQNRINKALKEENDLKEVANSLQEQANAFGFDYNAISEKEVKIRKERIKVAKVELINTEHYTKFLGDINKKLEAQRSTPIQPKVIVQPQFQFIAQDGNVILAGLKAFFNKDRIDEMAAEFSAMVADAIETVGEDAIISAAESIGNALAGGKNIIPNLFGGIMNSVGQQVQELGKFLIRSAITVKAAKKAFQALLANPVAAVAVGIGLIALGALLKAQAQKQFSGFASGTTGVSQGGFYDINERGRERVFLPRGASVQPANEVNAYSGSSSGYIAETRISATDLVILMRRGEQQMGRNN